jgi:hypothetical protein
MAARNQLDHYSQVEIGVEVATVPEWQGRRFHNGEEEQRRENDRSETARR